MSALPAYYSTHPEGNIIATFSDNVVHNVMVLRGHKVLLLRCHNVIHLLS